MPLYELYGRAFESDMPFPELAPGRAGAGRALRFERARVLRAAGTPFVIWRRPDGDPWVLATPTAGGYLIEYRHCAEFFVSATPAIVSGDTIDCSEEMFRHFVIDQVVPLALSLETIVLHASSVAFDDRRLVAFTGPGGAGKSTLATALARHGHAIGSDDGLLVDARGAGVVAVPAYPGVRLWNDSEAAVAAGLPGAGRPEPIAKQRFSGGLRFAGAGTLARLYVLDPVPARAVGFERLTPRDAVVELVRQTYRLALHDRGAMAREFDALADIAARVACWRLSFPRRLDAWRALATEVDAHIRAASPAAA